LSPYFALPKSAPNPGKGKDSVGKADRVVVPVVDKVAVGKADNVPVSGRAFRPVDSVQLLRQHNPLRKVPQPLPQKVGKPPKGEKNRNRRCS